jgi:hypothetical protein
MNLACFKYALRCSNKEYVGYTVNQTASTLIQWLQVKVLSNKVDPPTKQI